ncbi:sirohydrochlorin cobaltochelatase [Catenulispora sp. GAS73]
MAPSESDAARAAVVIVGGHEGGAEVAVEPLVEQGPLLRASSAGRLLENAVHQALDGTDLPVCVVPMTLGRDPQLVADAARTLTWLTRGPMAGRVMLAEPFGNATLLTGWLRVAVARVVDPFDAPDMAVLLTAKAANTFDDAELFRIAHLVKSRGDLPWVEVAFRGGEPDVAEGVERCRQLGAREVVVVPADFGPAVDAPVQGIVDGWPILTPPEISGMLATRIATALLRLSRGDDGIAAGLDADHQHGHGGTPWREADYGTD